MKSHLSSRFGLPWRFSATWALTSVSILHTLHWLGLGEGHAGHSGRGEGSWAKVGGGGMGMGSYLVAGAALKGCPAM